MKLGDIEDCDQCPLNGDGCPGGMHSSPGGEPIEPPCTSWDPNEGIEAFHDNVIAFNLAYEEEIDRQLEKEKQAKSKAKKRRKRAAESRYYVREETRRINILKKRIGSLSRLVSLANAFTSVNSMMNIEDKTHDKIKTKTEIEIESLREEIKGLKAVKKEKLKELRIRRKTTEV